MYSPFLKESAFNFSNNMAVKRGYNNCIDTIKPVRDFLDVMSGKWKFPILVSIGVGNDRFTDIQDSIPGITPKVLAKELKELEQHELIKRTITNDYPVKITYTRELYADTLTPIIYAMKDWGINHREKVFGAKEEDNG